MGKAEFGFPVTVARDFISEHGVRARRPDAVAKRSDTTSSGTTTRGAALHATDCRSVGATGSADCTVSGFTGGAGLGGVYIS
jgi:hypothetical protein